jgi:hypothetical protein
MARKPSIELTALVWRDATYCVNDIPATVLALNIGTIVYMDEHEVCLALERFDDGDTRHYTTVPRGMVVSMQRLHVPVPAFAAAEPVNLSKALERVKGVQ